MTAIEKPSTATETPMKTMIFFSMSVLLQSVGQLSSGDHSPFFVNFGRLRRVKIIQKLLRGLWIFRMSADEADQCRRRRDRFRQWSYNFDSRLCDDLTHEGQADIDLAIGEHLHRTGGSLCQVDLRFHLLGNAELLHGFFKTDPCRGATRRIGIRDRLRREQHLLYGFRRRYVRMPRARSDGNTNRNVR